MELQPNTKAILDTIGIGATYTIAAIVIFMLLLPLFGFEHLFPFMPLSIGEQNELTQSALAQNADNNQLAESQVKRPEATAGNITADIKPQGTALGAENVTSMEDRPEATAGNITADIKPQGTALGVED
jgi:hypothetical protein